MFEHILVATDFSPAWPLLRQRLETFAESGRTATLVHVLSTRYPAVPEVLHRPYYEQRLSEEAAELQALGFTVCWQIRTGEPGMELTTAAAEADADLLLLGSRGHGRAYAFLLGSTALDAARTTSIPLWLEPIERSTARLRDTLLLATDGSESALAAERMFIALRPRFSRAMAMTCTAGTGEAEQAEALAHLAALAKDGDGVETHVILEDPITAIVSMARDLSAGLVIVGKRGRNPIVDLLLGSTAEAVCRNAACAVLLVPSVPSPAPSN